MTTCSICGKRERESSMFVFYHSEKRGEDVYCCEWCAQQLVNFTQSHDESETGSALSYFKDCMSTISDEEVKTELKKRLEEEEKLKKQSPKDTKTNEKVPVGNSNEKSLNKYVDINHTSNATFGWIYILKVCAWVQFLAVLIAALIAAVNVGNALTGMVGFAVFLIGVPACLVLLSLNMVLIGAAEDIRAIRNKVTKE